MSNYYPSSSYIRTHNWHHQSIRILTIATFLLFVGRAWQHFFWDASLRVLFFDKTLMEGIVQLISGVPWDEYTNSEEVNSRIDFVAKLIGGLYTICAFAPLFIKRLNRRIGRLLIVGSTALLLLFILGWKAKGYQFPQLFEHSVQLMTPIFLYLVVFGKYNPSNLIKPVKIIVAITFICHGLYAIGFPYPQPSNFTYMTMKTLGLDQEHATMFLIVVGSLDFIVVILFFFPKKLSNLALIYALVWGFLTALARTVAYFNADEILMSLHQWLFQTAVRMPHALLPLLLLYWQKFKLF